MAVEFVAQTLHFWNYGGYYGPYPSPSVGNGEILATIKIDSDGRNAIATPYIIDGTRYFTVAKDQSGAGQAWTGAAKICYHLTPDLGVNDIYQSSGAQGTFVIMTLKGVKPVDPIGQTYGAYGFGNPDMYRDTTPDDDLNSLLVGGLHVGEPLGHYEPGNEGINMWLKQHSSDSRTNLHQYSELSTGGYGSVVRHWYDWGGNNDNVIIVAEFLAAVGGANQAIWAI